jgi:serine/threonine-protein kinase
MSLNKRYDLRQSDDWLVWRGEDSATGQLRWVKEANPQSPYAAQLVTRLHEEAAFLTRFTHPQILRITPPAPGAKQLLGADVQCSLHQYLASHGPLSPTEVANVLVQASAALDCLHTQRWGHGCVSPHTLLVDAAGAIVAGDFLGFEFSAAGLLEAPDPTPRYQAPELLDGTVGKWGPEADLYSLGFTALELLTGPKFTSLFGLPADVNWLTWHADVTKELTGWREALRQVPAGLLEVIAGLIPKRIDARTFKTANQVRTTLVQAGLTSDQRLGTYRPPGQAKASKSLLFAPPQPLVPLPAPARPSPRARLVLHPVDGSAPTRAFSPRRPVLVGRLKGCDVMLEHPSIGQKHTLLTCGGDGQWRFYDLRSKGGTARNGLPAAKGRFHAGDELRFGDRCFRVAFVERLEPFDQFELITRLHTGSRGEWYQAKWTPQRNRLVALQVFPLGFGGQQRSVRHFLRGFSEAAQLKHPHLVRLYRGGCQGRRRRWFIASEFLPGGSLRDRLTKATAPLPVAEVVQIGVQIGAAVQYLAEHGLVHQRIGPACILFTANGSAKLGDFLRLQEVEAGASVSGMNSVLGSVDAAYLAPEVVRGGVPTPASDVYSLAATLYQALTLSGPSGRSLAGPGTDRRATGLAVLTRALATNPAERYASAQEFVRALQAVPTAALSRV